MARVATGSSCHRYVACSARGVAGITESGKVFLYGAVGKRRYTTPTIVCDARDEHAAFTQIFAGTGPSDLALVDGNGGLYMLVNDNKKCNVVRIPAETFGTSRINKVAFGYDIALFLTSDGKMFTAGRRDCPATGCGADVKAEALKKILGLEDPNNAVREIEWDHANTGHLLGICCSKRVCAAWSRDAVWVWGESATRFLGSSCVEWGEDVYTPTRVQGLNFGDDPIKQVSLSEHIGVVSEAGEVYLWGNNQAGQLATGGFGRQQLTPCKLDRNLLNGGRVRRIVLSGMQTTFLMQGGEVWNAGHSIYSEQKDPYPEPTSSFGMERVMEIDCGTNHAVALNEEGVLYVWGLAVGTVTGVLQEPELRMGSDVRLCGLRTKTDLNGRMGKILKDIDHVSGRYEVEVRGYSTDIEQYCYSRVKAANLKHIRDHAIPKAVSSSWFEHEPVGLWHQLSAKKVLAFAMALHVRLGSDSAAFGLLPELLRQIVARHALAR